MALIIKRKLEDAFNASEGMEAAVSYIIENSSAVAQSLDEMIIKRLSVTYRMQVPSGTDMYD